MTKLTERTQSQQSELDVHIVERPACRVQALRHYGPASAIAQTYEKMRAYIGKRTVETWFGIVQGDSDAENGFVYHAAVSGLGEKLAHPDMELLNIAGGCYASHTLVGPYQQISTTMEALYTKWLPQSAFEADDRPAVEWYLNSPEDTAQENLRTNLLIPVRRAGI